MLNLRTALSAWDPWIVLSGNKTEAHGVVLELYDELTRSQVFEHGLLVILAVFIFASTAYLIYAILPTNRKAKKSEAFFKYLWAFEKSFIGKGFTYNLMCLSLMERVSFQKKNKRIRVVAKHESLSLQVMGKSRGVLDKLSVWYLRRVAFYNTHRTADRTPAVDVFTSCGVVVLPGLSAGLQSIWSSWDATFSHRTPSQRVTVGPQIVCCRRVETSN
ncbi:hypothetical protein CEXT_561 [Caerostris extrusa]|uniref:Uncharacterized protein n=1 Tax=Caerostris extrusa TaxID=172846 RepID=A0AAV4RV16_CAEEX|nr:hypothetical protein CEXT_561 [Caerostris extrusa]